MDDEQIREAAEQQLPGSAPTAPTAPGPCTCDEKPGRTPSTDTGPCTDVYAKIGDKMLIIFEDVVIGCVVTSARRRRTDSPCAGDLAAEIERERGRECVEVTVATDLKLER